MSKENRIVCYIALLVMICSLDITEKIVYTMPCDRQIRLIIMLVALAIATILTGIFMWKHRH